jgi:3-hydroxybutyryl-CoA dehydrogenase
MGSGIAQTAAQSGFNTVLYDVNEAMIQKAKEKIGKDWQTLVEKNKITAAEKETAFNNLHFSSSINDCIADIVIEAIIEQLEAKAVLFNQLAAINTDETIFASNTSSLSVTQIAEKITRPQRVIGMHFFNPAPVMKLVEVVSTPYTNEKTTKAIVDLATQMRKTPVLCKDAPGFIVNRVARPYYLESLHLAEQGIDIKTVDSLLEASGFRMGAFRLMDLIGNDVNYAVSTSLYEALGRPDRLRPSLLQQQKVENGELGKKTGKGYYNYE